MFKIDGFDELRKELEKMSKNAKRLDGVNRIPFDDLFTEDFMNKYSNFSTFDELLESGNFKVESEEDFLAIPDEVFDNHVRSATRFNSWQDMLDKATEIWVDKELNR